ncbi:MAG: hypothetical protein FJY67_10885, partial [Calditrichaeota bacterium]|nr:hypothetical protein [Calditrichota bacterium]
MAKRAGEILQSSKALSGATRAAIAPVLAILIIAGCDVLPGRITGDVTTNQPPIVEFANVPADRDTFAYAPMIHWKGRDADGFVEYYLYADVIDSTALADPDGYVPYIPEESWVRVFAQSDTIYLLTTPGRVTQHVLYLKCVDDRGTESAVIHRRFFRINNAPNVPLIKWFTAPDTQFATDLRLTDTLYVLDQISTTWPGLGFNWKSSDPDDRDLYRIPLEYYYYLERVPHDTIWRWVGREWTSRQELIFYGLETG